MFYEDIQVNMEDIIETVPGFEILDEKETITDM